MVLFISSEGHEEVKKRMLDDRLPSGDIHLATAAYLLTKEPENVSREERDAAKSANYRHLYGVPVVQKKEERK
jgi:DNA polymerase I-like protein with 3'-5' exonuclease and polymerase domains